MDLLEIPSYSPGLHGEPKRKTAYLCIQAFCWPKISGIILYKPSFSQSTVVGKPKLSSNATLSCWKHQPGMSTHPRPWRDPWWGWGWANPKSFAKWRFRNPKRGQEVVESYSNCEKFCILAERRLGVKNHSAKNPPVLHVS